MNSVNNSIPFVPENTIDPAAGLNESINVIDALLQLSVVSVGTNAPPGTPATGTRYIVGASPTGAWAGRANQVARWLDGAWQFFAARYALNLSDGAMWVRQSTGWAPLAGGGGSGGEANTGANIGDGQGLYSGKVGVELQFKSLLAGSNVTLTGDGDSVTISATGGGSGGGTVESVNGVVAVEFYQRSNILGTVSQSGGVPTGAIIERGSNANGEYVRFAGGLQIVKTTVERPEDGGYVYPQWPAQFIDIPSMQVAVVPERVWETPSGFYSSRFGGAIFFDSPGFAQPIIVAAIGFWH